MKQDKSYFTVILWILLAAIAAYFGYHVISSLYAPLMTATVTPYEAGAGFFSFCGQSAAMQAPERSPHEDPVQICNRNRDH